MGRMKELHVKMREMQDRIDYLEEELRWRQTLLKARTGTLYQLIQNAQDALQDLPEGMVD